MTTRGGTFDSYTAPVFGSVNATKGVEDKSGRLDIGTIGQVSQALDVGLKVGSDFYGTKVMDEAEQIALKAVDDYTAQGGPKLTAENTYVNSLSQGVFNPYEFQMRVKSNASELMQRNPGYTKEIGKKVNDIFDRTGITDRLKLDEVTYKYALAKQQKMDDTMNTLLASYGEPWHRMSAQEKAVKYEQYLKVDSIKNRYKAMTAPDLEKDLTAVSEYVEELHTPNGATTLKTAIYQAINDETQAILADEKLDDTAKKLKIRENMEKSMLDWQSKSAILKRFSADDPFLASHIESMNNMYERLMTYSKEDYELKDEKARNAAIKSIVMDKIDTEWNEKYGWSDKAQSKLLKDLKIIADIKKNIADFPGSADMFLQASTALRDTFMGRATEDSKLFLNSPDGAKFIDYTMSNLPTDPTERELNANAFVTKMKDLDTKAPNQRFTELTKIFQTLDLNDPEILRSYYNDPNARPVINQQLDFFAKATKQQLENKYDGKGVQIDSVDTTTGRIFSNDPRFNDDLERVNTYVSVYCKIMGLDPAKDAASVIQSQFFNE